MTVTKSFTVTYCLVAFVRSIWFSLCMRVVCVRVFFSHSLHWLLLLLSFNESRCQFSNIEHNNTTQRERERQKNYNGSNNNVRRTRQKKTSCLLWIHKRLQSQIMLLRYYNCGSRCVHTSHLSLLTIICCLFGCCVNHLFGVFCALCFVCLMPKTRKFPTIIHFMALRLSIALSILICA